MTEFDIDIVKIKENAMLFDKEVQKYNEAIENIYQVMSKLTDPAVGCLSGIDAEAYVNAVLTSNDHAQYIYLGEQLSKLVSQFDTTSDDLQTTLNNNKIEGVYE